MQVKEKIAGLRREMAAEGIDALIVGNTDPHNNEYVAERWCCRQWLTGMKGSSGTVVLTQDYCGLWADSRYYEIAEDAIAGTEVELVRMSDVGVLQIDAWLKKNLQEGQVVGFDGAVTNAAQAKAWLNGFRQAGLKTVTEFDLVDRVWLDRPAPPKGELFVVEVEYAGETISSKIERVREQMAEKKIDAYLLGRTDESCWLLNFRGTDVPGNPTPYCYTVVTADDVYFFIDEDKVNPRCAELLAEAQVKMMDYDGIADFLKGLPAETKVLSVPHYTNYQLSAAMGDCEQINGRAIVTDLKSIKNETEVKHLKQALIDDGVAMVKFAHWMYSTLENGGSVTELSASRKLEAFRAEIEGYRHVSFESIMGYAADGALNHYAVDESSDKPVLLENIFLIDSGGNFVHGTTDTTRVFPMGEATQQQKEDYTLVLRAMIDLIVVEFAEGATGAQLDGICRQSLWKFGRNYKHGTGHGVGFGLEVHEGPQGFSMICTEVFKLGQITTIEPGCYRSGSHGIRIENMVHTVLSQETEFGRFFKFENLTFCPINVDLVDKNFLNADHVQWLNEYNAEVYEKLAPYLDAEEEAWLRRECRAI